MHHCGAFTLVMTGVPFAEQLGEHHCFDVHPLLVAPNLLPRARERLDIAIQAHGLYVRNGWFEARPEQAAVVLLQALPCEGQLATSGPVTVDSSPLTTCIPRANAYLHGIATLPSTRSHR